MDALEREREKSTRLTYMWEDISKELDTLMSTTVFTPRPVSVPPNSIQASSSGDRLSIILPVKIKEGKEEMIHHVDMILSSSSENMKESTDLLAELTANLLVGQVSKEDAKIGTSDPFLTTSRKSTSASERKKDRKEKKTKKTKSSSKKHKIKRLERQYKRMDGFLTKQGHVVKNWQVRYFIIKDKELFYYSDQTMSKEKGKIALDLSISTTTIPQTDGHDNCFCINTSGKSYIVSAPSSKDKQNWMNAINFVSRGVLNLDKSSIDELRDPIVHKGWLEKKGNNRRNWKRRYMTLNEDTMIITYYESDANRGTNKKGEISLLSARVEKMERKNRNCFVIIDESGSRDFILSTETKEEVSEWVQAMQEAIDQHKKMKDSIDDHKSTEEVTKTKSN